MPDNKVVPMRGQTVVVKGVAPELRARVGKENTDVACIMPWPHEGCTIVGATREKGKRSTTASKETTRSLLAAGRELAPELLTKNGDFEVLGTRVGLRPYREGGPRVELEDVDGLSGVPVIHAYGYAGAG